MPVTKYRRIEDMPPPARIADPHVLVDHIRKLWARAFLLCPPSPRRGVQRFHSVTEADEERRRATERRMREIASRRGG